MKRIYTIFTAIVLYTSILAQSPEMLSYQAVIRNSNSQLVINQQIGIQISILQGSANGTPVFVETQNPTTNVNGLISIKIGNGTSVSGNFSTINWSMDSYFLKTEIDPSSGTDYTIIGTSQLLSVPYALYSKVSETAIGCATNEYVDSIFNILKTDTLGFIIDFTYTIDKVHAYFDETAQYVAQFTIVDMSNGIPIGATGTLETNLLNYGVETNGFDHNAVSYNGEYYIKLKYEINDKTYSRTKVIKVDFDYLSDKTKK